jgi:hypothetical protein
MHKWLVLTHIINTNIQSQQLSCQAATYTDTNKTQINCNVNKYFFNSLNAQLNPICHLPALLAHPILYVSRIRVKLLDEFRNV